MRTFPLRPHQKEVVAGLIKAGYIVDEAHLFDKPSTSFQQIGRGYRNPLLRSCGQPGCVYCEIIKAGSNWAYVPGATP